MSPWAISFHSSFISRLCNACFFSPILSARLAGGPAARNCDGTCSGRTVATPRQNVVADLIEFVIGGILALGHRHRRGAIACAMTPGRRCFLGLSLVERSDR